MTRSEAPRSLASAGSNRLVPLATAIIAVLAALGTLFAHHRSIQALAAKNEAILSQSRASDTYNAYEAKEIRFNIYKALLDGGVINKSDARARLEAVAERERESAPSVLEKAKALERQADGDDDRSEAILKSYELLQYAAAAFQISIILVSVSAVTGARLLFPLGCGLSSAGLVLLVAGLVQRG